MNISGDYVNVLLSRYIHTDSTVKVSYIRSQGQFGIKKVICTSVFNDKVPSINILAQLYTDRFVNKHHSIMITIASMVKPRDLDGVEITASIVRPSGSNGSEIIIS